MSEEFGWSQEHAEFRAVIRKMISDRAPLGCAPSPAATSPQERDLWRAWADELSLQGLAVPEARGGSGFSRLELSIAAEEMGRGLVGGPFFASAVLATEALIAAGPEDEAAAEVLPALAAGTRTGALAVVESTRRWRAADIQASASAHGGSISLTGVKELVPGGAEADVLVVAGREADGALSLFLVEPGAAGVDRVPCRVLDPSRPMARVAFRDAAARRAGPPGRGWAAVEAAIEAGSVFLAAEQAGGSLACLDSAVEHARTRVQFGRPIGLFQGVKHRLADMAVRTEIARSAATWAAWQQPGTDAAALATAVARAHCSESYLQTALDTIQVHGGMAITWEHHAHWFLRRARADLDVLPGPRAQRRRLEAVIGKGI